MKKMDRYRKLLWQGFIVLLITLSMTPMVKIAAAE
jgi:hypothetical protein